MKSELSAFIDDELENRQQARILSAIARDDELRRAWEGYHLIGDALRHSPALDRRLTHRVMERLDGEPAVLLPPLRRGNPHPLRAALAVAATTAGVALVAWVALGSATQPLTTLPVQARAPVKETVATHPPAGSRLQEYMVAHQTYSPGNSILGGTAYVRTVSAASGGRAEPGAR